MSKSSNDQLTAEQRKVLSDIENHDASDKVTLESSLDFANADLLPLIQIFPEAHQYAQSVFSKNVTSIGHGEMIRESRAARIAAYESLIIDDTPSSDKNAGTKKEKVVGGRSL